MIARSGPLQGVAVLEIEGIGPGPFAALLLANLGANVLRVARPRAPASRKMNPVLERGRAATIFLDLKQTVDVERLLQLVERADALIEGFRPGVMERLGIGPQDCLKRNSALVYGRITGWGRSGPLARSAGHDINYIALSGALHACGTAQSGPVPPLNLVGDFGGGGMLLAFGMMAALLEARQSKQGQVVDAAMIDGAGTLMAMIYGLRANGRWPADRAANMLDGSAYYYTCYECSDGRWVAVGAIEAEFRLEFLRLLGLEQDARGIMAAADDDAPVRKRIADIIKSRSRDHWQSVFDGTDACVSPVLSIDEAAMHPHNVAWGTFTVARGVTYPNPAPRFSRTPAAAIDPEESAVNEKLLERWQLSASDVA